MKPIHGCSRLWNATVKIDEEINHGAGSLEDAVLVLFCFSCPFWPCPVFFGGSTSNVVNALGRRVFGMSRNNQTH